MALPEGPRGQALALALTVSALALFGVLVVAPLLSWFHDRDELVTRREMLATRMEDLAGSLPALRARRGAAAPVPPLLEGATDAIASASLLQRVQMMASATGTTLASVETVNPETAAGDAGDGFRRIALRVSVTASWSRLIALLEMLDMATPRMLVTEFQVRALLVRGGETPALDSNFTIVALRAGAAPP
jgi:general secretion pathway protein M